MTLFVGKLHDTLYRTHNAKNLNIVHCNSDHDTFI